MACLNITSGQFINSEPAVLWNSASSDTAPNGTTITLTTNGANPGLLFEYSGDSEFFQQFPGANLMYMRFGDPANYILALDTRDNGDRFVTVIDTSGSNIATQNIIFVNEPSNIGLPAVSRSAGNGCLFFIFSPSGGGEVTNAQICRSDTGDTLCSSVPFNPSGQLNAEATATELRIKDGGTVVDSCPRPVAECDVSPATRTFPDAVVGAGVDPSLSSHIEEFTIENDGDDCLTINSIGPVGPFSFSSASVTLPTTLEPGDDFTVNILFAPTSVGNYDENLPINPTPVDGDTFLRCKGEARAPSVSIAFPGVVGFGKVPVGTSATEALTIANDGEVPVTIAVPASAPGLVFQWQAFNGSLTPGGSQSVVISFNPVAEGDFDQTLNFTGSDPDSPHSVTLQGEGCVANATMNVQPPTAFGNVQRGFRTVRAVKVTNNADGTLNFEAHIQGADAALFGLQLEGQSITSPSSDLPFSLNPPSPCGNIAPGSGEVFFGATFFANDVPGTYSAELVIDSHNATNVAQPSLVFPLTAEIIPLVNVDVELVLDRSGSMGEASGERTKIQTAIDAAQLFVQLGRPDVEDRIGVVRFNDTPEVIPALSIAAITNENQEWISAGLNASTLDAIGITCIAGGVMVAVKDIDDHPRASPPPELNVAIVVLTDGHDNAPYLNPDDGVTYSLLGENGATAMPAPTGKRLYAVGIGDSIDVGRLSILAQSTGGQFLHVTSFSGLDFFSLEKHFTQIYMEAVDLAIIEDPTYYIDPNDEHIHYFDVLKGDTRFMIVIYDKDGIRVPFYLKAPNGETVELTSIPPVYQVRPGITNTARFLEVALPEGEPDRYAGTWKVVLYHDGKACRDRPKPNSTAGANQPPSFGDYGFGFRPGDCKEFGDPILYGIAIGVGSNFRMHPFVQPGVIQVGEPIRLNAVVSEFSLPSLGCDVTVEAKDPNGAITHHNLKDDGAHQDDDADDGNYGRLYTATNAEGVYTFTFRAHGFTRDGEPVKREAVRSKYVEGRQKLVPTDPRRPGGGGVPGDPDRGDCCARILKMLRYLLLFLGVAIVLLLLLLLQ